MKKLLTFAVAVSFTASLIAGGLVTNTNQSASWVRLPSRDASTSIDATYFNPAGLMKLNNGFHVSFSNQTVWQNREVSSDYSGPGGMYGLNDGNYKGKIFAPVFPSVYAVYKMDKLAFSLAFNAIGGGGGAVYDTGLPSFEMTPSDLVPSLASQGVSEYRMNAFFEGSSVFFGYQGGVSYKINDMISVFAGVRYVTAKNTYNGYLRDIEIGFGADTWMRGDAFFTGAAAQVAGVKGIPTSVQPIIDGGGGSLTLAMAEGGGYIDAASKASIIAGLGVVGIDATTAEAMDIATISGTITGATPTLDATIAKYTATSTLLNDKEADVEQTASGITPIIGLNISPSENLNIGIKYEFATELEFTNATEKDILLGFNGATPVTMFPDGSTFRGDMPAMLSVGIDYSITDKLRASAGTHYYFDKNSNYGRKNSDVYVSNDVVIDDNFYELSAGVEYDLTDRLLVSAGLLRSITGVNEKYQNDLSFSLKSSTLGIGGAFKVTDKMVFNLGFGYSKYDNGEKTINHAFDAGTSILDLNAIESYSKNNTILAVGLDFSF